MQCATRLDPANAIRTNRIVLTAQIQKSERMLARATFINRLGSRSDARSKMECRLTIGAVCTDCKGYRMLVPRMEDEQCFWRCCTPTKVT
jgi:hypothetical protein